ncbi:MAG TPA: glutamate formimidoyltransferase, partial [Bacteroidetes bacterium]|nr:glutamate formimidoyltransferase [Bacteroidota bacterium]
YKVSWGEMEDVAVIGQKVKKQLLSLIDEDTDAFNRMMDAMHLPKKKEKDRKRRDAAIEEATKSATMVPCRVMEQSLQAMKLCKAVVEMGNINAASDAGVGALLGNAAVNGAFLNVKINLPGIVEKSFRDEIMKKTDALATEANILRREILDLVELKLEK